MDAFWFDGERYKATEFERFGHLSRSRRSGSFVTTEKSDCALATVEDGVTPYPNPLRLDGVLAINHTGRAFILLSKYACVPTGREQEYTLAFAAQLDLDRQKTMEFAGDHVTVSCRDFNTSVTALLDFPVSCAGAEVLTKPIGYEVLNQIGGGADRTSDRKEGSAQEGNIESLDTSRPSTLPPNGTMIVDGTDIRSAFSRSTENESFLTFRDPFTVFSLDVPNFLVVSEVVEDAVFKLSDVNHTAFLVYSSGTRPKMGDLKDFLHRQYEKRMADSRRKTGYNVLRENFFVVTGTKGGNRDFYECVAAVPSANGFHWAQFYFEYPKVKAPEHEPYIDHMLGSFLRSGKIR